VADLNAMLILSAAAPGTSPQSAKVPNAVTVINSGGGDVLDPKQSVASKYNALPSGQWIQPASFPGENRAVVVQLDPDSLTGVTALTIDPSQPGPWQVLTPDGSGGYTPVAVAQPGVRLDLTSLAANGAADTAVALAAGGYGNLELVPLATAVTSSATTPFNLEFGAPTAGVTLTSSVPEPAFPAVGITAAVALVTARRVRRWA